MCLALHGKYVILLTVAEDMLFPCCEGRINNRRILIMALLQQWRDKAYNEKENKGVLQRLWKDYFEKEKNIYAEILKTPEEVVTGTVKELAEKFDVDIMTMTGFLDGINDSLKEANPIEEMEEDTVVNLGYDTEKLYKNMVAAGANWLYDLPEWEPIYTEEKRKELYQEQKKSGTIVKEKKIYPNDPCPCGSGKKYKKCHGRP
jgi:preprotein translocase subunit SecA